MKKTTILLSVFLLLVVSAFCKASASSSFNSKLKDPVVIEAITKHTTIEEALVAAKNVLLANKFIATNGLQKTTFTAIRTTWSKADYFVADVAATKVDGKIKITISFVKIGTGLLQLQKVANTVKAELEK